MTDAATQIASERPPAREVMPPSGDRPGGARELMRLAFPLILSNSVWTLQLTIDRIMLSRLGEEHVAAAMAAAMLFWTPLSLFQYTASYATTFVAQYSGAGRSERVGPVVWQALYFSIVSGFLFLLLLPWTTTFVAIAGHTSRLQALEADYFVPLAFSVLPTLITAAASSFFAGRGDSWTVLLINAVGLAANAVLDYALIFGHWGFPAWGIAGAGWATVVGTWASAMVALTLLALPVYREQFAKLRGWRFEPALMRRLLYFGLPNGLQTFLDGLAFTVFVLLVGALGEAELAATSIAFTLNLLAFLPAMGVAQGVSVLVGQRLGQDQPALAERTTWTGLVISTGYMTAVALLYLLAPGLLYEMFRGGENTKLQAEVALRVPVLLRFVAFYSLFDSMNLIFAFALKGAGDTRFVTALSLVLAWPLMVIPTWFAWRYDWGLYWAWAFATAFVVVLALAFLARFIQGKWKAMRVIEAAPMEALA